MTFEYMGAHPRTPPVKKGSRRRSKKPSAEEEKLEETPVVAELRVAIAKEDVATAAEETPAN
ncbi:MAG: hypothetical protein Q7R90_05180 [bacterium]|nr:hypothetical protein [bacterium]